MKPSPNTLRIGIGVAIIVATIVVLVVTNPPSTQSYYVKIGEVLHPATQSLAGDKIHQKVLRVEGFVVPGSIQQNGTNVTFTMNEYESHNPKAAKGMTMKVVYKGSEPPPDTFKDDSQALAIGNYGYDGAMHATALQAKCASKYAPAGPKTPQSVPSSAAPANKAAAAAPSDSHSANPAL